jgi:hypothetical protein
MYMSERVVMWIGAAKPRSGTAALLIGDAFASKVQSTAYDWCGKAAIGDAFASIGIERFLR